MARRQIISTMQFTPYDCGLSDYSSNLTPTKGPDADLQFELGHDDSAGRETLSDGMPEGGWPDTDDEFECGGHALLRMARARCDKGAPTAARQARDRGGATAEAFPAKLPVDNQGAVPMIDFHGSGGQGGVTTVMIRNLPASLSQQDLMAQLDSSGYRGTYDFLHVPCDFDTRLNRGHAFINFDTPESAKALTGAWHGQRIFDTETGQPFLNIAPSSVQGLEANMKKWGWSRYHRVRTTGFRPFVRDMRVLQQ